ncbi:hypothetical protein BGZ96_011820 [Linnemannia gamsii]|uniref:Tubulin-specific chaperone A n=1 Tax=Linnemannia gamsii TaxID=64522 RepID=A0ABQ7JRJ4_9FUNG|nr:hypothetical protein BGZ96_011820 [Linnemannia gamsii]
MTIAPSKRLILAAEIECVKARIAIYKARISLFEKISASVNEHPNLRHHQHRLREEMDATVLMMPALQGVLVPEQEVSRERLLEEVYDTVASLNEALMEAQARLTELVAKFEAHP